MSKEHVVVLGGGVIGLSTAIALLDHPSSKSQYQVTIVARELPDLSDKELKHARASASYASAWAGAHHVSDAKTEGDLVRDKTTLEVLRRLHSAHLPEFDVEEAIVWNHQVEYFEGDQIPNLDWYNNYRSIPPASLAHNAHFGCTFTTCTMVVPFYMRALLLRFLHLGGRVLRAEVHGGLEDVLNTLESAQPSEFITHGDKEKTSFGKTTALVVSPGLGARQLLKDEAVHPVRGQTLLVRAPWCTLSHPLNASSIPHLPSSSSSASISQQWPGLSRCNEQGFRDVYIIPRGGVDEGLFIVGGTRLVNEYSDTPSEETTKTILTNALHYMPALAKLKDKEASPQPEDVDVVAVNVGLRPARTGGVRLERGPDLGSMPVVYNYGYGGYGFQASWGGALQCRDLIDDILGHPRAAEHLTLASLA